MVKKTEVTVLDQSIRPSIVAFAKKMNDRLNEKTAEHGGDLWYMEARKHELIVCLVEKAEKLLCITVEPEYQYEAVEKILVDIANYSMMLFDQEQSGRWAQNDFIKRIEYAIEQVSQGAGHGSLNTLLLWYQFVDPEGFELFMDSYNVDSNLLLPGTVEKLIKAFREKGEIA